MIDTDSISNTVVEYIPVHFFSGTYAHSHFIPKLFILGANP